VRTSDLSSAARCSPQPTRELRSRTQAEFGVDMGEVTCDRSLSDKERGGHLPVRAAFRDEIGDAALGGRPPFLSPAPPDASRLPLTYASGPASSLLAPDGGSKLSEFVERSWDRLAGMPFLPTPPPDDAERQQCPSLPEGVSHLLALCNGPVEQNAGAVDLPPSGGDQTTTSGRVRQNPLAGDPSGVLFPCIENPDPVLYPPELEQKLALVAAPPADVGLAPSKRRCLPLGVVEPIHGARQISTPTCNKAEDGHVLRGTEAELLLR